MYLCEASRRYDTHIIVAVIEMAWEIQRITGGQPVFTTEEKTTVGHMIVTCTYGSSVISFDLMCIIK
jgi:S-adenosylhomocysteine hydrolase